MCLKHFLNLFFNAEDVVEAELLYIRLSSFTVNSLHSPYKKLKEALSSVEAFERHYLVSSFFLQL